MDNGAYSLSLRNRGGRKETEANKTTLLDA